MQYIQIYVHVAFKTVSDLSTFKYSEAYRNIYVYRKYEFKIECDMYSLCTGG